MKNTWAEGLNPTYTRMTEMGAKAFVVATLEEMQNPDAGPDPEVDKSFLIQVLDKRIEVLKLPIRFTPHSKLAILGLVDTPGSLVTLLIDCLNAFEGKTVTVSMLADLYPTGFYDEPTLERYVNGYLKTRKVRWSELY